MLRAQYQYQTKMISRVLLAIVMWWSLLLTFTTAFPVSTYTSSQCHPLVTMTTNDVPLCYSIMMYPYFAYNLITSPFLVLNGYINNSVSGTEVGITQVGFVIQLKGVGGATRVFRGWVDGRRVRLGIEEFGEMDLQGSRVELLLIGGQAHVNSEVSIPTQSQFVLHLSQPLISIQVEVLNDGFVRTTLLDIKGLRDTSTHGLLGQFLTAHIDTSTFQLKTSLGKVVTIQEELPTYNKGDITHCWYVKEGKEIIEGMVYDYIVDNLLSTMYHYTLYKR